MISVLIASYNGEYTLPRTLQALAEVRAPLSGWELIAVDNGSTDNSAEILRSFAGRLPLHYILHPQRGKNRALNAALQHARGDLVVFTDDDVLADANWLVAFEQTAAVRPAYEIFGGCIVAHWEQAPPRWLLDKVPLGMTYAITDPSLPAGDIFPGKVWGANMMVRRQVFDSGLRFNESVGPAAGQYVMGGETEFNLRAAARGHRCCFVPEARISHIIRPHQLEPEWVLNRAFRFGQNMWNQERSGRRTEEPTLAGLPRWQVRRYVEHFVSSKLLHWRGKHEQAFMHDWEVRFLDGYFRQAKRTIEG